jgi:hypothetical protein
MRSWVLWSILKFVGNESHKNIPEGLHTMLECIHNFLFLMHLSYLIIVSL